MNKTNTPEKIAADIAVTRARLAHGLDELSDRIKPENVVSAQVTRVKKYYLDDFGGLRMDRAAKTAGVVVALAVLRKIFK